MVLRIALVVIASAVRSFRISKPNSVVFDEVHFGKFASRYIKTRYFVGVHPPLAKLLITLAAFVSGYHGHFDFAEIGKLYENTPLAYEAIAATSIRGPTLGIVTIPFAYLTLRDLDCRATTALLASLFLVFENALLTQSRVETHPSRFTTCLLHRAHHLPGFCNEDKHAPFRNRWLSWLALTGLSVRSSAVSG
ncbi:glycosyl transferase [Lactarius sanguifluus]|nr:glycosyl transferase [Lactarius sanguifluus]